MKLPKNNNFFKDTSTNTVDVVNLVMGERLYQGSPIPARTIGNWVAQVAGQGVTLHLHMHGIRLHV